jgi:hypothetical protein
MPTILGLMEKAPRLSPLPVPGGGRQPRSSGAVLAPILTLRHVFARANARVNNRAESSEQRTRERMPLPVWLWLESAALHAEAAPFTGLAHRQCLAARFSECRRCGDSHPTLCLVASPPTQGDSALKSSRGLFGLTGILPVCRSYILARLQKLINR